MNNRHYQLDYYSVWDAEKPFEVKISDDIFYKFDIIDDESIGKLLLYDYTDSVNKQRCLISDLSYNILMKLESKNGSAYVYTLDFKDFRIYRLDGSRIRKSYIVFCPDNYIYIFDNDVGSIMIEPDLTSTIRLSLSSGCKTLIYDDYFGKMQNGGDKLDLIREI